MPPSRSSSRSSSPSNKLPTLQTQSQRSQVKSFSDEELSSSSSQSEKKRAKKRPSINTRASRVGVTNFINVIKSLHPGESINYFPITEETLYELKENDDDVMKSNKQESSHQISLISPIPEEDSMVLDVKLISIVCFDTKTVPSKILDAHAQINLDNLKYAEPLLNLRKLYQDVAAADLSKYWGGNIDDSQLFYRNRTKDSFVHYSLNNEDAFVLFWTSFNERKEIIELVVYRKNNITNNNSFNNNNSNNNDNNTNFNDITPPQIIPNNLINNPINNSINN
ncbi:hypothetical protein Glove_541g17 [Diversispora epigaea]|uniref:Uncharacterized protein n=1 Tax=Diversispora epigaea TaxID=1348612 RepID=A0A397GID1_9GLOM|nr:hypothetical protein Glove_541g17 [Diversispora epigaea]